MMVTHINFAVDDELGEQAKHVKESNNWTWEEFFRASVEEFQNGE